MFAQKSEKHPIRLENNSLQRGGTLHLWVFQVGGSSATFGNRKMFRNPCPSSEKSPSARPNILVDPSLKQRSRGQTTRHAFEQNCLWRFGNTTDFLLKLTAGVLMNSKEMHCGKEYPLNLCRGL